MKYKIIILFALLFSSCTNISTQVNKANYIASASTYLKAEVEVTEKVKGSAQATTILGFFMVPKFNTKYAEFTNDGIMSILPKIGISQSLRNEALYDAMKSSKADIIVNPKYTVYKRNMILFQQYKVEVNGYKGIITGFKNKE